MTNFTKSNQTKLMNIITNEWTNRGLDEIEPCNITVNELNDDGFAVYVDGLVYDALNANEYFSHDFYDTVARRAEKMGLFVEPYHYSIFVATNA